MRKKEWEIQDRNKMEQVLIRGKVGRMGLYDGGSLMSSQSYLLTKKIRSIFILPQREEKLKS
ncbi:MAG: hypothetical protein ACE5R6_11295 [Candidatus Heimdallarchaeota archaeon]